MLVWPTPQLPPGAQCSLADVAASYIAYAKKSLSKAMTKENAQLHASIQSRKQFGGHKGVTLSKLSSACSVVVTGGRACESGETLALDSLLGGRVSNGAWLDLDLSIRYKRSTYKDCVHECDCCLVS